MPNSIAALEKLPQTISVLKKVISEGAETGVDIVSSKLIMA
jgi:hypothetical protein